MLPDTSSSRLEKAAANPDMPTTAAVAARSRALLEPAAFEEHMTEALRLHSISDMPFEHARTELMVGHYLRRHKQPSKARSQLTAALAIFERLGSSRLGKPSTQRTAGNGSSDTPTCGGWTRYPHSSGASGCARRCSRAFQQRGRRLTVPQYQDNRIPSQQRVPQTRH